MNKVWTDKELAVLAQATAADVGYEAVRWWVDETNPNWLRVEVRSQFGFPSLSMVMIATLQNLK